jgi:hypothetical protein
MIAMFQLQTILYNPKVVDKMTLAQFSTNVKGFNDGEDFSAPFLEGIYKSVEKASLGYLDSGLVKIKAQEALSKTDKIRRINF